ncbi:DNA repair protein RAD5A [Salvia divinorum]|uniref:DNA repair protein RAD5A n=1 Tax=Salvia divinorum TaxID=28513 RepID=A0ABD1HP45_SALDI
MTTSSPGKIGGERGRQVATCSEIIRFSNSACGEIGRIPNEWARVFYLLLEIRRSALRGVASLLLETDLYLCFRQNLLLEICIQGRGL